jgi:hypothetical protein
VSFGSMVDGIYSRKIGLVEGRLEQEQGREDPVFLFVLYGIITWWMLLFYCVLFKVG